MPVVLLVEDNADTREMYASFLGAVAPVLRVIENERAHAFAPSTGAR